MRSETSVLSPGFMRADGDTKLHSGVKKKQNCSSVACTNGFSKRVGEETLKPDMFLTPVRIKTERTPVEE